jgi:Rap1a immunity proteins
MVAIRILRALAGVVLLCPAPAAAQDGPVTGAQVLERCTSTEIPTVNWCMGFILGVGGVVSDSTMDAKYRICVPADATSDAGRQAVVEQLTENQALHDISGTHAVWYALTKAFACPK